MKALKAYWKIILGVILIAAAVFVYTRNYLPAKEAYENQKTQLDTSITSLQVAVAKNSIYSNVAEEVPEEEQKLDDKRLELYQKFPLELKEEDQIMYVLYLEDKFGTEIEFEFGTVVDMLPQPLSDNSMMQALVLTVNYQCTYDEFQEMITYLATDDKITSIYDARMEYDPANDIAVGTITLMRYLMDSELLEYQKPDISVPETGKENIFVED